MSLSSNIFIKRISLLLGGATGAQALNLVSMLLITRIYSPENLGELNGFVSLVSILIPLSTFCLYLSFFVNRDIRDDIFNVCFWICLKFSIILYILILFIKFFFNILFIDEIGINIYFLPIAVFFGGLYQIIFQYLLLEDKYYEISKSTLYSSFFANFYKISSGYLFFHPLNLVLGYILGYIIQILFLSKNTAKLIKYDFIKIKKIVLLNCDFIKYRSPQVLINACSEVFPLYFIIYNYSMVEAGFYGLARSILSIPSNLIGKVVSDAFLPKFSEMIDQRISINKLLLKSIFICFLVGLFIYSVFIFYGEFLFIMVFGKDWGISGIYAGAMSIWLIGVLSTRPVISAITLKKMQKFFFFFELVSSTIKLLVLYILFTLFSSVEDILFLYSFLIFLIYIVMTVFCLNKE